MMDSDLGYVDLSLRFFLGADGISSTGRSCLVRVVKDPIPVTANIEQIEPLPEMESVRVRLSGVEPRQYRPLFTAYHQRQSIARLVVVNARSRNEAIEDPAIPREGEFDGSGTVHSLEASLMEDGRYEVRINYRSED